MADIARTDKALAEALGVTTRSIRLWKNRGVPQREDGTWDIDEVQAWRTNSNDKSMRNRSQNQPTASAGAGRNSDAAVDRREDKVLGAKRAAEAKAATHKADILDLELRTRQRQVMETSEHVRILSEMIYLLRRRFDALARSVPKTAKRRKRWQEEFDRILDDLAAKGER